MNKVVRKLNVEDRRTTSPPIAYQEVKRRIGEVNGTLRDKGYSWLEIENFWEEIINEAR